MAFFKSLFGQKTAKTPKGFEKVAVREVRRLTEDAVQIVLEKSPAEWPFEAGQYLDFAMEIDGAEVRRSYSLCSGPDEALSVAVKSIPGGKVSNWFNKELQAGESLLVKKPAGAFILPAEAKHVVAIAAGSGITPILSMMKTAEGTARKFRLFYGNKTLNHVLFREEITALKNTDAHFFLSQEEHPNHAFGRINKEEFGKIIRNDLSILKADCFVLCGPEEMIVEMAALLEMFGVHKDKIRFELFTTPVLMKAETTAANSFEGDSSVTVRLDGEKVQFNLKTKGKSILEASIQEGLDAPYSCKGGVCSTCKAKLVSGTAHMNMNYVLTDREVEAGYILTCQAHPTSEEVEVNYDV
jgi:ring-1,2-phenylacetyl-CoA epoxidase subunit PaaE